MTQRTSKQRKQEESKLERDDINYMGDCMAATLLKRKEFSSFIIYTTLLFVIVFLIWAGYSQIDKMTTATGKIIPSSQVQVVEELYDGIVKDILVRKGEVIEKGQPLIVLDSTQSTSEYRQAQARMQALRATVARLHAQAQANETIAFPQDIKESRTDLMQRETNLFNQRVQALKSTLTVLKNSYDLAKDELRIIKPLVTQGVTSRIELLRLERQVNELNGDISKTKDEFQDQALSGLTQLKAEIESLHESMVALRDKMHRTSILSPVRGTVKKVNVHTIGAVIKSGMDIMEIVPLEDSLLVEGRVKPADIGFIRPHQKATVKLTAYDFSVFGGLEGEVEYISPDTIMDERNEKSYYLVTIRTARNHLGTDKKPLLVIPGMTATVHILAGKRSILDYLLKPILRAKSYAFTEF